MLPRLAVIVAVAQLAGFCEDWDPKLAAQYLDSRQKEWFAWPRALSADGPCVSCHTGVTYLLARPALRRVLGESEPTSYEKGLLNTLRAKVAKKESKEPKEPAKTPPSPQTLGVEAVLSALFLAAEDSLQSRQAFDQLWSFQIPDGKAKGAWAWFNYNLDPWETPEAAFYGASLAALAAGAAPADYRNRSEFRERLNSLTGYLQHEQQAQPLHNRLTLLWAASKLHGVLPEEMRRSIIDETLRKQQDDGGWAIEALGPWNPHPEAPVATGSNSYATGFATFVLRKAGLGPSDPSVSRSLKWLRSHQDRQFGYWPASSLNKRYEADSIPLRFMQDAATAFATLALLEPAK